MAICMAPPSKISLLDVTSWICMLSSPFFGDKAIEILLVGFVLNGVSLFCYIKDVEQWNKLQQIIKEPIVKEKL